MCYTLSELYRMLALSVSRLCGRRQRAFESDLSISRSFIICAAPSERITVGLINPVEWLAFVIDHPGNLDHVIDLHLAVDNCARKATTFDAFHERVDGLRFYEPRVAFFAAVAGCAAEIQPQAEHSRQHDERAEAAVALSHQQNSTAARARRRRLERTEAQASAKQHKERAGGAGKRGTFTNQLRELDGGWVDAGTKQDCEAR